MEKNHPLKMRYYPSLTTIVNLILLALLIIITFILKLETWLMICVAFTALIISSLLLCYISIKNIKVLRILPHEIFASTQTTIQLQIHNLNNFTLKKLSLYEDFSKNRKIGPIKFFDLQPHSCNTQNYECLFPKRGEAKFKQIEIIINVGLAGLIKKQPLPQMHFIYPQCVDQNIPYLNSLINHQFPQNTIDTPTFKEYQAGMPVKYINWKLSAKSTTLITQVQTKQKMSSQNIHIFLPIYNGQPSQDTEFAISIAASTAINELKRGNAVSLWHKKCLVEASCGIKQRTKILTTLARLSLKNNNQPR